MSHTATHTSVLALFFFLSVGVCDSPVARACMGFSAAVVPKSHQEPKSVLPDMGNLGLQSASFVSPQLRSLARSLNEEQIMDLTNRIRTRVAMIAEQMQLKFSKRKSKFDDNGVFDVHVNKARAEAMHHVELQRRFVVLLGVCVCVCARAHVCVCVCAACFQAGCGGMFVNTL